MSQSDLTYPDPMLREVLTRTKSIATVGVSLNEVRPSFFVARYLKTKGYRVIPVNPRYAGEVAFGAPVVPSLAEIPGDDPVHMVDIFRRSEDAGQVVDAALEVLLPRGLQTIWMQIGVIDHKAAARAEAKGVTVIMDRCPKMEYQRLWRELGRFGVVTGQISSKLH
ncbi:MAG: CoA-binding protein [Pseudomonadota bacterium]